MARVRTKEKNIGDQWRTGLLLHGLQGLCINNQDVHGERINNTMNKDSHLIFEQYDDVLKSAASLPKPKSKIQVVTQWDKNDIDKSQVHIEGFGVLILGQLKDNVAAKLEDLAKRIKNNEPDFVLKRITEKYSALMRFIKTLVLAEKDVEHMRRAGQLTGIAKRSF